MPKRTTFKDGAWNAQPSLGHLRMAIPPSTPRLAHNGLRYAYAIESRCRLELAASSSLVGQLTQIPYIDILFANIIIFILDLLSVAHHPQSAI